VQAIDPLQQLQSDDAQQALQAAQDLLEARSREAVPALLARLARIDGQEAGDGFLAAALIEALAELAEPQDPAVCAALFALMESDEVPSYDDAPIESAFIAALRRLRPAGAAEWLRARFLLEEWCPFADETAEALGELEGPASAAFFLEAARAKVDPDRPECVIAAVRELGRLHHGEAAPLLEKLKSSPIEALAEAARDALLQLVPGRAETNLLEEIAALDGAARAQAWEPICRRVVDHKARESVVPLLRKMQSAVAVRGSESDFIERAVWSVGMRTAPEKTRPLLEQAYADTARSSWTRLCAGLWLLRGTHGERLDEILALARQVELDRSGTGKVARVYVAHLCEHELPEQMLALARTGARLKIDVMRALDRLRRGPQALPENAALREAAAQIIHEQTGIERYSQFEKWLIDQETALHRAN